MSSVKILYPYMSVIFAGILGFQSLAVGQAATDTQRINPQAVKGKGISIKASGKTLTDDEQEAIELLSLGDQKLAQRLVEVKKSLELTSDGLRDLDREPIRNPNLSAYWNEKLNQVAKGVLMSNFVVNYLVASKFKDSQLVSSVLAINMLLGVLVRNLSDPNQTINVEKIFRQVESEITSAQGNKSISPEVDAELKRIRDAASNIVKQKGIAESFVTGIYSDVSGVGNPAGIENVVAYLSITYAILKIVGERWKPAKVITDAAEEFAEHSKAVGPLAKKARETYETIKVRTAEAKSFAGQKVPAGLAHGSVTGGDLYSYAMAASSQDAVIATQKLASDITTSIVALDAEIQKIQNRNKK